jgi:hypothetical protein
VSPPHIPAEKDADVLPVTRYILLLPLLLLSGLLLAGGVYQEPEDFLEQVFNGKVPEAQLIWLTGARKQVVKELLGHRYPSLRVRYWQQGQRTTWILEEVGKTEPITTGFVIDEGRIETVKVLVFRESRGWEIRYPFFTDQFDQARLNEQRQLDRTIDGISGATLSVRALKKLAAMALYLDQEVRLQDV